MNSPKEIAQNYIAIGIAKTKLSIDKMLVLGVLAGMFIALAGVGSTIAPATIASDSLGRLIGASVFPAGLAMVLLAGSELFTGNCLLVIPLLQKEITLKSMLKNWCFVYIGNFIGSIFIALLAAHSGIFSLFGNATGASVISTAITKVSLSFSDALMRGILCNFLVCLAVWMSFAAKDVVGKIAGLFFPIMLFVLSAYEHSIANMYFIPAGLFASRNVSYVAAYTYTAAIGSHHSISMLTWGSMFTKNLIPSTIGNIIGGVVIVGMSYWLVYLRGSVSNTAASERKSKKK